MTRQHGKAISTLSRTSFNIKKFKFKLESWFNLVEYEKKKEKTKLISLLIKLSSFEDEGEKKGGSGTVDSIDSISFSEAVYTFSSHRIGKGDDCISTFN